MWCTTFAFQTWHSAVEFKRYLHRFIHEFPKISNLGGIRRTRYNQYDSIIYPVQKYLESKGVIFKYGTKVTDIKFNEENKTEKFCEKIEFLENNKSSEIQVSKDDLVYFTNGCMTESSSLGSMDSYPVLKGKKEGGCWTLWEKIAKNKPEFGKPKYFCDKIEETYWESFTVTLKNPIFLDFIKKFSGNELEL
jgi:oleate hydratase